MRFLSVVVLAILAPAVAKAASPTCALLDPEKTPRAALLEAKLLADTSATWVERINIDKVLKEQKLQAMFSPEGVGDRVKLGKLLKADVLVMVRTVKAGAGAEPALEVVVSETAGGLRLLVRAVAITKDTEADVTLLLAAVRDGIKKHGEKITDVVAVPPFVSQDFEATFDYLKGAFAKLAETEALDRKGVVVVELAEAEAVAKELALAAPGSKLDRPLPVYLLGEYRHEGKGSNRTLSLKLRAERGGKVISKPAADVVKPDAAPNVIRTWAAGVLDALAKDDKPRPPADAKAEAKQLAERARLFAKLGAWSESLMLIEASLLLDDDQTALRMETLRVITAYMSQLWNPFSPTLEQIRKVRPLYRRGLEHFEIAASREDFQPDAVTNGTQASTHFTHAGNGLVGVRVTAEVQAELTEMQRDRQETLLRMIPGMMKRGRGEELAAIRTALWHLSPKERYEVVERHFLQFPDQPQTTRKVLDYGPSIIPILSNNAPFVKPEEDAEYRAFLDRLGETKNSAVQAGASRLKEQWIARVNAKSGPAEVPLQTVPGFSLLPIELTGPNGALPRELQGIMSLGSDVDVVWAVGQLYLVKEKGKLRPVWSAKDPSVAFANVCFDGKLVWATTKKHRKWGSLVVLDPATEKAWEITGADGLPQGTEEQQKALLDYQYILAAPVEPGRACVSGTFGKTWVALVSFDVAAGKPTIKVIHETRETQDAKDKEQAGRATVDFYPTFMFTLRGQPDAAGKAEVRVIVGRGGVNGPRNPAVCVRPLVIDPLKPAVEVAATAWPESKNITLARYRTAEGPDQIIGYAWADSAVDPDHRAFRVSLPNLTPEIVARRPFPREGVGQVVVDEKRLHLIEYKPGTSSPEGRSRATSQWLTFDEAGKSFQTLGTGLPHIESVWSSSHYGLVVLVAPEPGKPRAFHAVELPPPAKK